MQAQEEYRRIDRDHDQLPEYAQKIISSPARATDSIGRRKARPTSARLTD